MPPVRRYFCGATGAAGAGAGAGAGTDDCGADVVGGAGVLGTVITGFACLVAAASSRIVLG